MKKFIIKPLLALVLVFAVNAYSNGQKLIITGVIDGPLSGGTPKAVELYVISNISDLSNYGISSANNGNGPTGAPEDNFPQVAVNAGDFIYVSTGLSEFNTWFGFNPDFTFNSVNVNGDDAIELFQGTTVIDLFGDPNVNGSGTAWDYEDGWAYRKDNKTPSALFNSSDWTYSGKDALDGETSNSTATTPFPDASYTMSGSCSPITTLPWTEDFENSGSTPNCWTNNSSAEIWKFDTLATQGPSADHTSGFGYFAYVDDSYPNSDTVALISPQIDVSSLTTPSLSFWMFSNEASENVTLRVDLDGGSGWTNGIATFSGKTSGWEKITLDISSHITGNIIQARFVVDETSANSEKDDIAIDDVEIDEAPNCFSPYYLNLVSRTDSSASINWTNNGSASSWNVVYGNSGFNPNTGGTTVTASSNTFTINGLTPGTLYDVYVQSDCGSGNTSTFVGPLSFSSYCTPVASLPWTETFEDASATRDCWTQVQETGNKSWTFGSGSSSGNISGAYAGSKNAVFTSSFGGPHKTYLISPVLELAPGYHELEYYYGQEAYYTFQNTLKVYYRTSSTSPWIQLKDHTGDISSWTSVNLNLPVSDPIYQIAFKGSDNQGYANVLDSVTVSQIACPDPDNLMANPAAENVELSWNENGTANQWNIVYGSPGFNPASQGTTIVADSTIFTVSGLLSNTSYDAYVQSDCGGSTSNLVGPVTFTTDTSNKDLALNEPVMQTFDCNMSDTAHLPVEIENTGNITFNAGSIILFKVKSNGTTVLSENISLPTAMAPGDIWSGMTNNTVDLSNPGVYDYNAYITYSPDENPANDTASGYIVHLDQQTDFAGSVNDTVSILSSQTPYTINSSLTITPDSSLTSLYSWETGSTNNSITVSSEEWYSVTVTTENCITVDSVYLNIEITDLIVTQPDNMYSCSFTDTNHIPYEIKNIGGSVIPSGDNFDFKITNTQNSSNMLSETITLNSDLNPGETISGMTNNTVDLSTVSIQDYGASVNYAGDEDHSNDTLFGSFISFTQTIDFIGAVNDTINIYTSDFPYTIHSDLTLNPDSSLTSTYLWSNGSTNDSATVNINGWQTLTVTTEYCTTTDSVYINATTPPIPDLALKEPASGTYDCDFSDTTHIPYEIENVGTDTIHSGETITFTMDDPVSATNMITENITLNSDLDPGNSISGFTTNTADLSNIGAYDYIAAINYPSDVSGNNDTIKGFLVHINQTIDFVNEVNDTISVLSTNFPYLINTNITIQPDSSLTSSYLWGGGQNGDSLYVNTTGWYYLTVNTASCTQTDSVYIDADMAIIPDIKITEPKGGYFGCDYTDTTHMPIGFKNVGNDTIPAGEVITFYIDSAYTNTNIITEDVTMSSDIYPGDNWTGITSNTLDMSSTGTFFFDASVDYASDSIITNNSTTGHIVHFIQEINFIDAVNDTITVQSMNLPYTINTDIYLMPDSSLNTTYSWVAGGTNDSLTINNPGWYVLNVSSTGCVTTDSVYVDIISNLKYNMINELSIYPNPNKGTFRLNIDFTAKSDAMVSIINSRGKVIRKYKYDNTDKINEIIKLDNVSAGLYNIRISSDDIQINKPVIIR